MFTEFRWNPFENSPYSEVDPENSHLVTTAKFRATKIPLTAYINSPTSGAPLPAGDNGPRAVSDWWYDKLCPEHRRLQVNSTEINVELEVDFDVDDGIVIIEKWAKYLGSLDAQCVNLKWDTPRIIDFG